MAAIREVHNSPATFITRRQLVVFAAGSEQIIQDTDGPASDIFLTDFDQQGRVLYSVVMDDFVTTVLLGGPDLQNDRVLRTGDPLFGQPVTSLSWVARPAAAGDGETRAFAFQYDLDDGSVGIALASQGRPRWTNPAGGDWSTASNWTPANVPGAGEGVRFDLDGAYAVNLSTQQVGSVQVRNGDVTFRNGELNMTATEGGISVSGNTPDAVARLTILDTGATTSTVVTAATVSVGFGGPGELRIENARLRPPEEAERANVILGFTAPATATVSAGGIWNWREMFLGMNQDSLLRVEDGAFVGFGADQLIVGGSPLALPVRNQTATANVDNASNNAGPLGVGALLGIVTDLVIGESLIGKLEVRNGARTVALTTTVGTRDHDTRTDGFLTVEGTNATLPARFESGGGESGGLFVATGTGTDALMTVSGGGVMTVTRLSLADGAQSNALMFVDGMEAADASDHRSTVTAPFPREEERTAAAGAANGDCVIGNVGQGALNVSNGALVRCRQIAVGMAAGSRGEINIDGIFRSVNARVIADGPRIEDGAICIGRVPLCGATSGFVRGDVVIGSDGILEGRTIGIGSGGRLRGSGLVITTGGVVVIDGGSVAPGVVQLDGQQRAAAASHQVGTLTIQGNLTVSETGVITLHVLGATANLQDRLVVSGAAALHGQIALNFGNGYAPKRGDRLALIQAQTITGAPQEVLISGLAPGFDYDVDVTSGVLTLVALNDGTPTTQETTQPLYLPLIQRSGW